MAAEEKYLNMANKPTHILISISFLESEIKELRKAAVSEYHAIANNYRELVNNQIKICLDDETMNKLQNNFNGQP